jgi:hypothetical protein
VGRSRRVFPREILGLILSRTDISRDDVGAIRILDNYSFVQVRNTVADTIIETINGAVFRGRPLLVNYARTRKDPYFPAGEGREGYPERDRPEPPEDAPCSENGAGSGLTEYPPEGDGPEEDGSGFPGDGAEGGFAGDGPEDAGGGYPEPPSEPDDYGEDQGDREDV